MTESRNDSSSVNPDAAPSRYRIAVATAVVGAVFSLIVCVFMAANYGRSRIIDTPEELELLSLRAEIPNRPDDEQLVARIRELDLQIRQRRARAIFRSRKGSYLLLGGVIVFLIGAKCADSLKKKLPAPPSQDDPQNRQAREAMWSRWAVTAGVAMLVFAVFSLMAGSRVDFAGKGGPPLTPYPTIEQVNRNWASFRGPNGAGISTYTSIPTEWDGETGEGILWKTKVPIGGNNSPVVWGDRIFLAGGDANDLQVYCVDTESGRILWTGDVTRVSPKADEEPFEPYEDTGYSTPTVVTNGRQVCAIFVTGDVGCFDMNGRKLWEKSLGIPDSMYGYAASLAIYQNVILVQFDQATADDGLSELIALDGPSGEVVWRKKRPVANSWSSPIVAGIGGKFQLITCADPWVIAYDPVNGSELWRVECLAGDIASTPVYAKGLTFVIEPYTKTVAIRTDGQGQVTETHIAWTNEDGGPDICSPVTDGEVLLNMGDGLLTCLKVSDGTAMWEEDLRAYFFASPSLVGDKLYLLDDEGVMSIAEYKPKYKELTKCKLGEECRASPAFADGRIYIRGVENLYCIAGPKADSAKADGPAVAPYPSIEEVNKNWSSFRGPGGSGISAYTNVPTKWDGESGQGIVWKTRIPVGGNNSPVIWDDRIFLAGGDANDLQVYGFDATSGSLLWTGDVTRVAPEPGEDPFEPFEDTGFSTPTVVTNGRQVCAIFVTGDVGCFDMNGRKLWEKSLGLPDSAYGYASSLAIYQDKILIQFDQATMDDGLSEMIALDGPSGEVAWRKKRPVANSWSSPVVVGIGDKFQLITCADPWVLGYEPASGSELWRADCLAGDIASTPVCANGLTFVIEPYSKTVAIRTDGQGQVTETHIAWTNEDGGPDICSPVTDGEVLLNMGDGLLTCLKVSDGTMMWEEDLRAYFFASPSLVGDKLYLLDDKGVMFIAEYKPKYKELAKCKLGEECRASPAFADGRIYIRGLENLYCIGAE
ncbi:MAG: PQQ-binding-like beta-propeller repeat protein [Phycisphaerales bacterium]|nr:MAG: PQQ-binding-like beta-propeller repeat protein [Phycisphaerales bacterium]